MTNDEKKVSTYTQEQVDDIVNSVKSKKDTELNELRKQFNDLESQITNYKELDKKNEVKDYFVRNGGNVNAFDDWYKVEKDFFNADLTPTQADDFFKANKESKSYFYNSGTKEVDTNATFTPAGEQTAIKELVGGNFDLYSDTMYKKNR